MLACHDDHPDGISVWQHFLPGTRRNQLGGRFHVCQVADRRLIRTWRVAGEADPGKLSPHATSAQVLRGAAGQGFRWHASTLVGTSKDMSRHPSPSFRLRNLGTGAN